MTDPLLNAARALRETTHGEPSGSAHDTRARVLARVRGQSRRRAWSITFGVPLAAILVGSGAWAASGERLPALVQRVSLALGWQQPIATTSPSRQVSTRRAAQPKSTNDTRKSVVSERIDSGPAGVEEPSILDRDSSVDQRSGAVVTPVATSSALAPAKHPVPGDSPMTERDLSLYEVAHRAHFVEKDWGRALNAWSDYLRVMPRGRFVVEARYNRALCLLRLARNAEAKKALEPFARGTFGDYRRAEATALIEQLDSP